MRQRLTIILTIVVIVGLLVLLNVVTYVKDQKTGDSEFSANRSTYHTGPTGLRAFYDYLSESGHKVMRWRESTDKLLGMSGGSVRTLVVVGRTQLPFTMQETSGLLNWIDLGGHLVLIDRDPQQELLPRSGKWRIAATQLDLPPFDLDATDQNQMTERVTALKPDQPSLLTQQVQEIMPSRFAARLKLVASEAPESQEKFEKHPKAPTEVALDGDNLDHAPVVHIEDRDGALLVDYKYGAGRITVLGDPFIVANNGIRLRDNLRLAINLVTNGDGLIAFDEYHQGRGITQNEFASYFSGTPVIAIGAQIVLLVLFIIWTGALRFARPIPLAQVDRRSSLEFVASMSELQERSRAYDLAVENIYARTRRVLARYAGVDYNSSRSEVASRVALRSTIDAHSLETLMRQCEETINGAPTTSRQALDLVRRLREVERTLGLRMRSRDARQAVENI
ncbi:MAG TPA: DUF4350 domain-containing protein [Pyrinomonadaceae bacterium]